MMKTVVVWSSCLNTSRPLGEMIWSFLLVMDRCCNKSSFFYEGVGVVILARVFVFLTMNGKSKVFRIVSVELSFGVVSKAKL